MNTHTSSDLLDVIIVGAGPTGLSAALILGLSLKRVLVIDSGKPRNALSHAANSFFSRDGIAPSELLQIGREQLQKYETVKFQTGKAMSFPLKNLLDCPVRSLNLPTLSLLRSLHQH